MENNEPEAEQPVNQLVSRILDNVLDLSTVLATQPASTSTRPGATRPQTAAALPTTSHMHNRPRPTTSTNTGSTTEAAERQEMRRIFSGSSSSVSVRDISTSSGQLRLSSRPNSSMSVFRPNRFQQLGSQSLTTSKPMARSNQRTLGYSFSRPSKGSRAQASNKKGPFTVDLLLLPNPTMDIVPKQAPKVELIEKGHFVIGAQLMKEWTPSEIMHKIRQMFGAVIPEATDFTLCTSVNAKIVRPILAPGQILDGFLVHRIFKNKTIYVRPDATLLDMDEGPPNKKSFVDISYSDEEADDDFPILQPRSGTSSVLTVESVTTATQDYASCSAKKDEKTYVTLSEELEELAKPLFSSLEKEDALTMIVRRRRIWDDSINKILLFEEESLKRLNFRFVGEMGADYGGPTREFFAILLEGAPILSGVENSHVFLRDAMRLDRREYEAYGRLVALALLHKCAGPHNLSRSLVDYILDPENVVYNPNDIPDFEVRRLVLQLMECNTTASMDMLSQELDDIRIDAGYNKT